MKIFVEKSERTIYDQDKQIVNFESPYKTAFVLFEGNRIYLRDFIGVYKEVIRLKENYKVYFEDLVDSRIQELYGKETRNVFEYQCWLEDCISEMEKLLNEIH